MKLDEFTTAYIKAAFWSSIDENDDQGGEPLEDNYNQDDLEPATLEKIIEDCKAFQKDNWRDFTNGILRAGKSAWKSAGHDFWLTRNGHGAGFWDGDWEEEAGERLTAASEAFGEYNLLVGTNGTIYGA